MKYFRFKNWERFQHYHDRNPPWVKLSTAIIDLDNDWYRLTDAQCGVLAKMLAWASRTNNAMPLNADVIREEIHADSPVDISHFVRLEILEVLASRSDCVAIEKVRIDASKDASKNASGNASKDASKNARLRDRDQRSESEEEKDQKKNPPTPRKRGAPRPLDPRQSPDHEVAAVVAHLNAVTGKSHSLDRGNQQIIGAIKRGATVDDCKAVIDHCWRQWGADPKMVRYVDKSTPFRAANFDRYLDESRAGAPKPTAPACRIPPKFNPEDDPDMTPEERDASRDALARLKGIGTWPS